MFASLSANGAHRASQARRWSATIVANLLSTYALDTVSTVAGVLLVASGLLAGTGLGPALLLLLASYGLWGWGLSTSLEANWRLLEATGISTSLLSKLAYDLTAAKSLNPGFRRLVCAAGYVVFELAKESLYYIGAFGVAVVSDSVGASEALVFLAGANAGAAVYEYGLGWSTKSLLARAAPASFGSFATRSRAGSMATSGPMNGGPSSPTPCAARETPHPTDTPSPGASG